MIPRKSEYRTLNSVLSTISRGCIVEHAQRRMAIAQLKTLPTLPAVVLRVLETAQDPDASALDLGKIIVQDQSLAANVLKLVNSAAYGQFRQVEDINRAVVTLGFSEVRNVVLSVAAINTMPVSSSGYERTPLWRHSMATATAADNIDRLCGTSGVGGAFTAGLLHDIGKVALDALFPSEFMQAAQAAGNQNTTLGESLRTVMGVDHFEAGTLLAAQWNLPIGVVDAIGHQETPDESSGDGTLARIVALANGFAIEAGYGEPQIAHEATLPDGVYESLGLQEAHRDTVLDGLREAQPRIEAFVSALS
jgi:HD-like signal output (HDOD) protein